MMLRSASSISRMNLISTPIRRFKHNISEKPEYQTVDGCTAVTHVAYAMSDSAYIFPITPSSPIAELAEQWSSLGVKNAFGDVVKVTQLQSEAGAAGALHGALVTGSLATTFTASQGALLMIPTFYKISGELLPCAVHIAARAIASQGLSIFGDHQDIMALRSTGFAILGSATVQECHDMALVSHLATLRSRVPFHHFFDGFRLSHTIEKIQMLPYAEIRKLVDYDALNQHHSRALNPIHPHVRGSNQNPDVYFQMLETSNKFYESTPQIVNEEFEKLKALTGRSYKIFDYFGPESADSALVVLGSGASVVQEVLPYLHTIGHKVGLVVPRLFRPWSAKDFLAALPPSIKRIAVLDRTKEPGSLGEPLYLDVAASVQYSGRTIKVIGGRFGLGQKEFTPGCVVSIVQNLSKDTPMEKFTVGIEDDVSFLSLPSVQEPPVIPESATECLIYGFGSDGTVGANKNAIKIIGDNTDKFVQGYFAYGSQKAGGLTVSHLRFGPEPFKSYYSVMNANYIGCHNPVYVDMYRMLDQAAPGGTFCLNSPWKTLEDFDKYLPSSLKRALAVKSIQFYNIDAFKIAEDNGMGRMINVVMQSAFFKLSNVISYQDAIEYFKKAIKKSYSHRGDDVVKKNFKMVDDSLENLHKIEYPSSWANFEDSPLSSELKFSASNSDFIKNIQGPITLLKGDQIKVSTLVNSSLGGVMPMGTAALEKRGVALEVPEVDMNKCTQCNYCSLSCPHAVIRPFLLSQEEFDKRPETFDARKAKGSSEVAGLYFRIQVSPYDCTGCSVCVNTCPDDALRMVRLSDIHATSSENWDFSVSLPDRGDRFEKTTSLKGSQFQQPLLEFSGACSGCGETPYVKLVTQLFGNRMIIANATGCSSIWGAPFGSNPYTVRSVDGKGPAWGNSLFEDAAEYGLGMAVTTSVRRRSLKTKVQGLLQEGVDAPIEPELYAQLQEWVDNYSDWKVCDRLSNSIPTLLKKSPEASSILAEISNMSDMIPKLSVWVIGGDGWAYDIGFGGLDHALASGQDMNVLVLDTEVYSNTGGQKSKATPLGAIAKFATGGREQNKKSLAEMALSYGTVYVANVSMGASMQQTLKAFIEAERYTGPSLVIAYSPCIEHKNIDGMSHTMQHMAIAANSGYFPLFRYNPDLVKHGKNPFSLDTKRITVDVSKVVEGEMRYGALKRRDLQKFNNSVEGLRKWIDERFSNLQRISNETVGSQKSEGVPLTILYGSETGNTQELAFRTADHAAKRGFNPRVMECDEVQDIQQLLDGGENLLVMCATCGEGDAPKNAGQFVKLLAESTISLKSINYSVFAMGDSSYHKFCSIGKSIDSDLERLGANRFSPLGIGNDRDEDKFETGFSSWSPAVWQGLNAPEVTEEGPGAALLEVIELSEKEASLAPYKRLAPDNSVSCESEFNKRLTSSDYNRDIRHLRLKVEGDLPYLLGDVLNVSVVNNPQKVESCLKAWNYQPNRTVKFNQMNENLDTRKKRLCARPRKVSQVFEEVLDIFGRPSRTFYKSLSKFASNRKDQEMLELIASDTDEGKKLYNEMAANGVNYADILTQFPSARPPLEYLISMIPCTKPRLYSIASSPRFVGQEFIELAIVILDWKGKNGSPRNGTGTDYIKRICDGDKVFCTVSSGTFNFPASPDTPMIMAGLGTGLAPFRAFIQERAWLKNMGTKSLGNLWLFYGCRYRSKDYIFGDELEEYKKQGVLNELHPAFSRDQSIKVYVQDKIDSNRNRVYTDLVEKHGFFYLCGQAGQTERDIKSAIYRSIAEGLKVSETEAQRKFEEIAEEGRYCPELY
jgi:pyruvate dehydrogenase (NADP+)